jgi:predicted Zn-dependent protease
VRLMLQGDDAVDEFIKLAPPLISKQFGRVRREQTDKSRVLWYSLTIPALIGLLAAMTCLVYWLFAHEVSQWAASKLTAAHREQLGASAFEQVRPSLKLVERGLVRDTVQFVGVRVSSGASNRYYYHVADSAQINTIFLPGGHLVINTGLLRSLQNTNELAAMLAHAASHEEMRHTLDQPDSRAGLACGVCCRHRGCFQRHLAKHDGAVAYLAFQ